jgi:DNA-binding winged helix-turn-helix (wHTH) protein
VKLTPKAFGVLRYFVGRPGQLVTKDDLLAAVWPQTVVEAATLASCIQALRRALRDKVQAPRYIETVPRRGYSFIAPLTPALPAAGPQSQVPSPPPPQCPTPTLVGRAAELTHLHGWLRKALEGQRQIVFVTGEPGLGRPRWWSGFCTKCKRGGKRVIPPPHQPRG